MSTVPNPRPFVPYEHRDRHVYLVGKSGHGKSTLMERAIMQDIENGAGVILLDAKGDLAQSVLDRIPFDQVDRTIYLDAGEPVPIDFMSWETDTERQTLSTDIYQTFMSFSESPPGDRWVSVLRKTITTLLDARCCSFLDINDFIEFPSYREKILARVHDERTIHYWKNVFPKYPSDAAFPILTRMGQFMDSAPLLTLLGRSTPPPGKKLLSLFDVMQERKILLVDLAGAGKSNANDIGRLLMSKIQQAAFRRRNPAERIPCFLYVDEFQNFQTSAFDVILSEARAFKLCLTLANQGLYQLEEKIKNAIFGNVSALWVLFCIDERDTHNYRVKVSPHDAKIIAQLPRFQAMYKVGDEPAFLSSTPEPLRKPTVSYAADIRARTRDLYYCPPEKKDLGLGAYAGTRSATTAKPDPEPDPSPRKRAAKGK